MLTVLADSACGLAVGAALTERMPYATLDLRMDYLRPAGPEHEVFCEAHCYRVTRSVAFVRAEVWQQDRSQPIATAQATFMLSTPAGTRRSKDPIVPTGPVGATPLEWTPPAASAPVRTRQPIPYVDYLGVRVADDGPEPLYRMPYQQKLIGNPYLPALHGGVIAGFAETAAMLHLAHTLQGASCPRASTFPSTTCAPAAPKKPLRPASWCAWAAGWRWCSSLLAKPRADTAHHRGARALSAYGHRGQQQCGLRACKQLGHTRSSRPGTHRPLPIAGDPAHDRIARFVPLVPRLHRR